MALRGPRARLLTDEELLYPDIGVTLGDLPPDTGVDGVTYPYDPTNPGLYRGLNDLPVGFMEPDYSWYEDLNNAEPTPEGMWNPTIGLPETDEEVRARDHWANNPGFNVTDATTPADVKQRLQRQLFGPEITDVFDRVGVEPETESTRAGAYHTEWDGKPAKVTLRSSNIAPHEAIHRLSDEQGWFENDKEYAAAVKDWLSSTKNQQLVSEYGGGTPGFEADHVATTVYEAMMRGDKRLDPSKLPAPIWDKVVPLFRVAGEGQGAGAPPATPMQEPPAYTRPTGQQRTPTPTGDADMGIGLDPVDPEAVLAFEREQRYGATLLPVLEPGALTEDNPATRGLQLPDLGAPIRDFANAPDVNVPGVGGALFRGAQELARGTQPTDRGRRMQEAGYEYDVPGLRGLANIGERTIGRQDANTLTDRWYNGTPLEKVLDVGGQAIPVGAMPFARSMLPGGVVGGALEVAGELAGGTAVGPTQAALRAASGVADAAGDVARNAIAPVAPVLDDAGEAAAELLGDMGGGAAGGVMGLRQASQGLPAYERIANRFRAVVGMAQTNDLATPIMQERKRIKEVARNQAAVIGAEAGARVRQAFKLDKQGLVQGLDDVNFPNGMTVQDAAARMPTVWDNMTPEQQATMRWLQESLAPYRQLWDDVQAEAGALVDRNAKTLNSRADVMDGGFYIPRGSADIAGMDEPVKVRVLGGTGAGKGFQRAATFDSAAEGIANGYEYATVEDAIRSYVRNIGDDIANRATANTLLELTDDTGARLAQSAADRVDPQLRGAVQSLAGQIGQRRITALSRRVRGAAQGAEAGRADRMAERADKLAENAEKRLWQRVTKESPDTVIASAERELLVLRREASKDLTAATKRRGVSNATATKLQATLQELDDFQNQLTVLRGRYQRAQDVAKSTPRERGRVDMVELQAYDFPDAIANAANMALKEEQRLTNPGVLDRAAQLLQGAYRTTTATLDNSAVGIQGLLGWYGDPKATSKALGVNLKSMLDPDAFGAFVQRFDENAKGRNLPDVMQWTRSGLRVAGPGEEMRAGAGLGKLTEKVRNAPGIKQADRMFTAMGDSLRLGWAQDEAETMMRQLGRPLTDQELEGIAKSINRFTGYTSDPAGGAISDLLLYSPRYFQSRVETTLNAVAGLRPGATLEQKLARRTVARTLVGGAMITYAANAALGQDTDARPVVPDGHGGWKRNPNFMRIRFNDKDFSVFGGYDSLLGLVLTAATGKHDQALRQFLTGPIPSTMWDLWVGSTVDGKRTRDKPEQMLRYLAESFAPFSAGDIGGSLVAGGQAAMAGDPVKAAAGATAAGLTFLGAKQSPMSYDDIRTELVQKAVREAMDAGNPDGYTADTTIDGLSKADMRKVYEDARLKAKGDQFEDAPIPDAQRINQAGGEYDVKRQNLDAKLGDMISKGVTGKDLKEAIQQWKRDGFTAYDTTLGNPEVTAASARLSREKRPPLRDQLAQKYWDVPMEELPNGQPDFKSQQAAREAILNEARGLGYDTDYMTKRGPNTYRGQSIKDERVREAVERYEQAQETLRPYWDLTEKAIANTPAYAKVKEQTDKLAANFRAKGMEKQAQAVEDKLYKELEPLRDLYRLKNPDVDKALAEWYGYTPIKEKLSKR